MRSRCESLYFCVCVCAPYRRGRSAANQKYPRCPGVGDGGIFELGFLPPRSLAALCAVGLAALHERAVAVWGLTSELGCGGSICSSHSLLAATGLWLLLVTPALQTGPCSHAQESPGDPPPGPALPAGKPAQCKERSDLGTGSSNSPERECLHFQPGSSSPEVFYFYNGGLIRVGPSGPAAVHVYTACVTLASCPVTRIRSPRVLLAHSPTVRREQSL